MYKNTVIIIQGPTASGKTALALQLAKRLHTSIISADSRQCYKELNIGVAKPTGEELNTVKHYFINTHSIHETVTAKIFEEYALQAVNEIFSTNNFAVMAGGTGFYIKAFCRGLNDMPEVDPVIRKLITHNYTIYGLAWLQQELQERDPLFWKFKETQNPGRLMRALEVLYSTGRSIETFRKQIAEERPFNIIKVAPDLPREQLYNNINCRTDQMMADGLLAEAESLFSCRHLNALQTTGYKELFEFIEGGVSLHEAVNHIKTNTRQYAKRQFTWFRKDNEIKWMNPVSITNYGDWLYAA